MHEYVYISKELELYKQGLLGRPAALVVTKMDTPGSVEKLQELVTKLNEKKDTQSKQCSSIGVVVKFNTPTQTHTHKHTHTPQVECVTPIFRDVVPISALHGVAIESLKKAIMQLMN